MEEGLTPEHSGELLRYTLEQFLNGGAVADKRGGHLETTWWDVANSGLYVVGDPFNEVAAVLVLDVQHLFVNLLHRHSATEHGGDGEVSAVTRIAGRHHVLCVEHLLCQFRYGQGPILLTSSGGQGCKPWYKEVKTREWHHIDSQFTQIGVELARESETGGDSGHCGRDKMVQVPVCWCCQFQGSEADVIQSLVIDTERLVSVFNQLVDGEGGVVGFHYGVRYLGNGKGRNFDIQLALKFSL